MNSKDIAAKSDAGFVGSGDGAGVLPLLGRKSVLIGMAASMGAVFANAAEPSAVAAGTVKPPATAATQPAYALKWAPSTAYVLGQQVVSPNNDVVSAKVAHRSSAAFATDKAKWALSSTYVTRAQTTDRSILVADYGPLGTADDSPTINLALGAGSGRRVIFPPHAVLNCGENTLTDAVNTVVDGNGTTLFLKSTGARFSALNIAGTCKNVQVEQLRVKGSGLVADHHAGISGSGATLEDVRVIGCHVEDVTLGISFSAEGSGSINGLLYEGNTVKHVVGETSGDGYGLHVSISGTQPANVRIIGNTIRSAQRHAIYQAKGLNVTILGNSVSDHRDETVNGNALPALMITRSSNVTVLGNTVSNGRGGAIYLGGPVAGGFAGPYTVIGNTFSNALDGASIMYVGELDPTDGTVTDAIIMGNTFERSNSLGGIVTIYNGRQLRVTGNTFKCSDVTVGMTALMLAGSGVTQNDWMDDVSIEDNYFDLAHANSTAIRFSPGHEVDTTTYWFRRNRKTGARLGRMFTQSANITNPNISIQDQVRDGLFLDSTVQTTLMSFGGATIVTDPGGGSAAALPGAPRGYLAVNVNGTDRHVAFYD